MGEMERVFVVAHHDTYEGHSEPLAAFRTRALADIFVAGAEAGYASGMKVFELPVQTGIDAALKEDAT